MTAIEPQPRPIDSLHHRAILFAELISYGGHTDPAATLRQCADLALKGHDLLARALRFAPDPEVVEDWSEEWDAFEKDVKALLQLAPK